MKANGPLIRIVLFLALVVFWEGITWFKSSRNEGLTIAQSNFAETALKNHPKHLNLRSTRSTFSSLPPSGGTAARTASSLALRLYPKGKFMDGRVELIAPDEFRRIEIIQTALKYPFIRVATHFRLQGTHEVIISQDEIVADHVVLSLQPGATDQQLAKLLQPVNGTILRELQVDGARTFLVSLPEPGLDTVPDAIQSLSSFSNIVSEVDGDSVSRLLLTPNDPRFNTSWQFNNTAQEGGTPDSDIDLTEAWSIQTGNPAVLVAISDTGVDIAHADLKANLWTNVAEKVNSSDDDSNSYKDDIRGWNFYHGNNNVSDDDGHGTFCSGIIGAEGNNGIGVAGVAWRCKMIPLRSLDTDGGFASDISEGFDYARRMGARVVNASHGGGPSSVMQGAVNRLQAAGILLVAAAGNSGEDTDFSPLYPASYSNPNIISVAATTHLDDLATFSSYGATTVDLAAPGVKIPSTARRGTYALYSGTSFSVPQVTGVAALIFSQNPAFTATQVRARILNTVDKLPSLAGKCVTGGRLNAYKALLPPTTLLAALDNEMLNWSTGGDAHWTAGISPFSRDGADVAETGKIWHDSQSLLQTQVAGPGSVSFWWKVSSQPTYDYLAFYVDDVERSRISGNRDWAQATFTFGGGSHTLTWSYIKDGSVIGGDDKGLVDQFIYHGPPPIIAQQPLSTSAKAGGSASFLVEVTGMAPFKYQWRKNNVDIAGATRSSYTLNSITAANAGNYSVVIRNAGGSVTSTAGNLKICQVSLPTTATTLAYPAARSAFRINMVGTCPWSVQTTNDWITLNSNSFVESSSDFSFSVSQNDSRYARLGIVTIGDSRFLVKQLGIPAPETVAPCVFSMTITNSSDLSITNGSFLLNTRTPAGTNTFDLISGSDAVASDVGTFNYDRTDGFSGVLTLSGSTSSTLTLNFESPSRGTFVYQPQGSENLLYGTFAFRSAGADFNNDSYTDILWQTPQGTLNAWCMRGVSLLKTLPQRKGAAIPAYWKVVAPTEYFQSGEIDVILQHTNRRTAALSLSPGTNYTGYAFLRNQAVVGVGWQAVTSADFNQDGKRDLVFQHLNTSLLVWYMDGTNFLGSSFLRQGVLAGTGWKVVGSADFNRDLSPDLLWQHQDGRLQIWSFVGPEFVGAKQLTRAAPDWRAVALGDYNNDGDPDILFRHTNGKLALWFINNMAVTKIQLVNGGLPGPTGWRVVGPR